MPFLYNFKHTAGLLFISNYYQIWFSLNSICINNTQRKLTGLLTNNNLAAHEVQCSMASPVTSLLWFRLTINFENQTTVKLIRSHEERKFTAASETPWTRFLKTNKPFTCERLATHLRRRIEATAGIAESSLACSREHSSGSLNVSFLRSSVREKPNLCAPRSAWVCTCLWSDSHARVQRAAGADPLTLTLARTVTGAIY